MKKLFILLVAIILKATLFAQDGRMMHNNRNNSYSVIEILLWTILFVLIISVLFWSINNSRRRRDD